MDHNLYHDSLVIYSAISGLVSADQVRQYQKSLSQARDLAATNLQKSVFSNYTEFVVISKEVSQLEAEMLALRGCLNDLKVTQSSLRNAGGPNMWESKANLTTESVANFDSVSQLNRQPSAFDRERDLADRRQLGKVLLAGVEGTVKCLAPNAERALVLDGSHVTFWELSGSTMKQKQQVRIHIFSDALVVACRKKNIMSGKNKVLCERAWLLEELAFADLKDTPEASNAIKITKHPDAFIYRAETEEDKRALLYAIKRAMDASIQQKKLKREADTANKMMGSNAYELDVNAAQMGFDPDNPDQSSESLADNGNTDSGTSDNHVAKRAQEILKDDLTIGDFRWLMELPDELDVLIAHRDFKNAVHEIEKGRAVLEKAHVETTRVASIRSLLEERTTELSRQINLELASPVATKSHVQRNMELLLRIGLGAQARDIFLSSRTSTIRHRVREIKMDGDIVLYIDLLSEVVFRSIRNTHGWYSGSFDDTTMASGFMKWVIQEIEFLGGVGRRQVFSPRQPFREIASCLTHMREHSRVLSDVGMDITFVLDHIFHDDILSAIQKHADLITQKMNTSLHSDMFTVLSKDDPLFMNPLLRNIADRIPRIVSKSVYEFYILLTRFGDDTSAIMSIKLYSKIVGCLVRMFENYIQIIVSMVEKSWNYPQQAVMLVNCTFVVDTLLPMSIDQLADRFERPIPELQDQRTSLQVIVTELRQATLRVFIKRLLKTYPFARFDYTNSATLVEDSKSSEALCKMLDEIHVIAGELKAPLNQEEIMGELVDGLLHSMLNDPVCWEDALKGPRRFGYGGVHQFILDMNYLLRVLGHFVSEKSTDLARGLCERALKTFFSQTKEIRVPMKKDEWYEARVEAQFKKTSKTYPLFL